MSRNSSHACTGILVVLFLVAAVCTAGCSSAHSTGPEQSPSGTLIVHGSTAVTPALEEQARVFTVQYPDTRVEVTGSSSGEAIYYLLSGKCDIAPSARPPTAAEYAEAKNTGKNLHMTVVGYDGVAVLVHSQNPVSAITSDQIRQIFFNGSISAWEQIPGSGKTGPIRVYVQDPRASATAEFFVSRAGAGMSFVPTAVLVPGSSSELLSKKILTDPDGITFSSTAYVYPNMKALQVDGVAPRPASLSYSAYPISRKLYVITDGKPQGLTKEFINFLFSEAGRKITTGKGIVPVSQVQP
ncbi:MAG: phosphate ABC transporter substrate-binding protein [Methanomicrobiales archaeon]|nr:phosphate ABC transporter substrate-binding protein [Methanomicrobiales archaeon]